MRPRYSSMSRRSCACSSADMSAAASPSSSSFCTLGSLPVTISENAVSRIVAICRRAAGQHLDQLAPEVFFGGQQPKAGIGPGEHARGIRADEHRRDDGRLARKLR